jgi:hypothetical protein
MSDKHLERKEVLNLVYTRQADRMADAYARLMADFSQMTAWGRGIESDLSWARVELMQVKAELERVRLIAHDNKQALYNAKAEVERLTKAGDAMHCFLIGYIVENRLSSSYLNKLDDDWANAAKGVQS